VVENLVEEPMLFIVEGTPLHGQENKIGCDFLIFA
jgi:hypothetical protein